MQFIQSFFFSSTNFALIALVCLFIFAGCSSIVASTKDIKDSRALQSNPTPTFDPLQTQLAKAYKEQLSQNPNLTAAVLVSDGIDAFLNRAYLARNAQKTLILQTYIYKNDIA